MGGNEVISKTTEQFLTKWIKDEFKRASGEIDTFCSDQDEWYIYDGTKEELETILNDLDVDIDVRIKWYQRPGEEMRVNSRPRIRMMGLEVKNEMVLLFSVGDPACLLTLAEQCSKFRAYKRS